MKLTFFRPLVRPGGLTLIGVGVRHRGQSSMRKNATITLQGKYAAPHPTPPVETKGGSLFLHNLACSCGESFRSAGPARLPSPAIRNVVSPPTALLSLHLSRNAVDALRSKQSATPSSASRGRNPDAALLPTSFGLDTVLLIPPPAASLFPFPSPSSPWLATVGASASNSVAYPKPCLATLSRFVPGVGGKQKTPVLMFTMTGMSLTLSASSSDSRMNPTGCADAATAWPTPGTTRFVHAPVASTTLSASSVIPATRHDRPLGARDERDPREGAPARQRADGARRVGPSARPIVRGRELPQVRLHAPVQPLDLVVGVRRLEEFERPLSILGRFPLAVLFKCGLYTSEVRQPWSASVAKDEYSGSAYSVRMMRETSTELPSGTGGRKRSRIVTEV
ncbi:hypothetical protein ColKHC_07287 [Colletotrichum higginsianum]|nr:hypothetical protein ColKHC_07287 [Colletotrichum higginsianum]